MIAGLAGIISRRVIPRVLFLTSALLLTACGSEQESAPQPERIALEDAGPRPARADPSPDTSGSGWIVAASGQAIHFGNSTDEPFLTLACELGEDPIGFTIIRHAEAFPGQTALFPFVGNGMRSRFLSDATLAQTPEGGEWRWETHLPADDPQLDVFAGTRDLTATLPGRGMLEIAGSRIPGQFLDWCRAGGETPSTEPNEEAGIMLEEEEG